MTSGDRQRWNERYAGRGIASAARPVALEQAGLADEIPATGRALDVACGLGAQSIWLAQRGFEVTALDVSDEAVSRLRAAAIELDLETEITTTATDLDAGLSVAGPFDVIVCQRFRAPHLYDAFVDRLAAGGVLLITVLSVVGADRPGEFHAPAGELAGAFDRPDLDVLFSVEADGESSLVARRSA